MLEPPKRYGINPKSRSRDGFAVKLQPLASCDQQAIADVLANSSLRSSALIMHLFLRFISTQPGSILPSPCGPILIFFFFGQCCARHYNCGSHVVTKVVMGRQLGRNDWSAN